MRKTLKELGDIDRNVQRAEGKGGHFRKLEPSPTHLVSGVVLRRNSDMWPLAESEAVIYLLK